MPSYNRSDRHSSSRYPKGFLLVSYKETFTAKSLSAYTQRNHAKLNSSCNLTI